MDATGALRFRRWGPHFTLENRRVGAQGVDDTRRTVLRVREMDMSLRVFRNKLVAKPKQWIPALSCTQAEVQPNGSMTWRMSLTWRQEYDCNNVGSFDDALKSAVLDMTSHRNELNVEFSTTFFVREYTGHVAVQSETLPIEFNMRPFNSNVCLNDKDPSEVLCWHNVYRQCQHVLKSERDEHEVTSI